MTSIESLPDDLISEILVRVPAQDNYDSTRLVCRKWYNIINTRDFAHSNLQLSTSGLLDVNLYTRRQILMTMQKGRLEPSKLSYGLGGTVLSSCNGLVLGYDLNSRPKGPYIIANPVTKQQLALPKLLSETPTNGYILTKYNDVALVYAPSSRTYKVVCVSLDRDLECAIMTAGVDMDWGRRVISTQHLPRKAKKLLKRSPLTTRGFVHWTNIYTPEYVLTMNAESETITQIPGPCLRDDDESLWYRYLPMGSCLSLLIGRGEISWEWELWKMKPETGEWTKMPSIVLEPQKVLKHLAFKFKRQCSSSPLLKPIGWSNSYSGEVLFFGVCSHSRQLNTSIYVAYNIRTREFDSVFLKDSMFTLFLEYKSSLVWLD
ncbi:hypothetical protein CASFOL_038074 [Castilleja foliolosa]|uniref:F-box domain-containing protein n=1 Tax=Castilleja foliolosa TaxID=1961234 RepID=A0ABD3BJY3_9LAMI